VIDATLIYVSEKASKKRIDIKKDLDPGLDIIAPDKLRFKLSHPTHSKTH
jgi:hypothetical protein